MGVLYSSFFLINLGYAFLPKFSTPSDLISANYVDFSYQTLEWNVISQFGEILFVYYPQLLMLAALILFVAIVSPVVLSFVSFSPEVKNIALSRRQVIFTQTLRCSVDRFAK